MADCVSTNCRTRARGWVVEKFVEACATGRKRSLDMLKRTYNRFKVLVFRLSRSFFQLHLFAVLTEFQAGSFVRCLRPRAGMLLSGFTSRGLRIGCVAFGCCFINRWTAVSGRKPVWPVRLGIFCAARLVLSGYFLFSAADSAGSLCAGRRDKSRGSGYRGGSSMWETRFAKSLALRDLTEPHLSGGRVFPRPPASGSFSDRDVVLSEGAVSLGRRSISAMAQLTEWYIILDRIQKKSSYSGN